MNTGASDVVVIPLDGVATVAKWIEPCVAGLYCGLGVSGETGDGSNDLKYASTKEIGCRLRINLESVMGPAGVHAICEASLFA
jgi:hypothetical protein